MSAFNGATLMITGGTGSFGNTVLNYEDCPEQFRDVHFAKEEKKKRYEALKMRLTERLARLQRE